MIDRLQKLEVKTKTSFHQDIGNHYDEMNCGRQNGYFQF